MKHYFLLAFAIIAVLLSGCQKKTTTDPVVEETDYTINLRIYTTIHMIDNVDFNVYYKAANTTDEVKLKLESPQALDKTLDQDLIEQCNQQGMTADSCKVYVLSTTSKKGTVEFRWDMKDDSVYTDGRLLSLVYGYVISCPPYTESSVLLHNFISPEKYQDRLQQLSITESFTIE